MIKTEGAYKLKEEFFKENNISVAQYRRRKEDLLEGWKEFYDYEIIEGKPIVINITKVLDEEYRPLPRKKIDKKLTEQKIKDYEEYVKNNLPKEFEPESKINMARKAIGEFGEEKYNHYSEKAVSRRYVGPAMNKYGEHSEIMVWVDYNNYELLDEEVLLKGKEILKEEHMSDAERAAAFDKIMQNDDIEEETKFYKKALKRAKDELHITPIHVYKGKVK